METFTAITKARVVRQPLALVLIGGLALYGRLAATAIVDRGKAMGLDYDEQARSVLDLIDRGLASVIREGGDGYLLATPAIAALSREYLGQATMAYVAALTTSHEGAHGHA